MSRHLFFCSSALHLHGLVLVGRVVYFHLFALLYKHNLITFLSSWRHQTIQYMIPFAPHPASWLPSFDIIYALFSFVMKISVVTRLCDCISLQQQCIVQSRRHYQQMLLSNSLFRKMDDPSDYPPTTLISIYVKFSKDSTLNLHIFSAFDN